MPSDHLRFLLISPDQLAIVMLAIFYPKMLMSNKSADISSVLQEIKRDCLVFLMEHTLINSLTMINFKLNSLLNSLVQLSSLQYKCQ